MNKTPVPAQRAAQARPQEQAVVVANASTYSQHVPAPRDLRLQDFKSSWALSLENVYQAAKDCYDVETRVLGVENTITLRLNAAAAEYTSAHKSLISAHTQVLADLIPTLNRVTQASKAVSGFDERLNGKDGVAARFNGFIFGNRGLAKALDAALGASINKLEANLIGADKSSVSKLNAKLFGKNGTATRFDASLASSVSNTRVAMNELAATANQLAVFIDSARNLVLFGIGVFAAGTVFGAVLVTLLRVIK